MMDWSAIDIESIRFDVDAESVQEVTGALVFPLKVYDTSGEFLFTHPVSIRAEFYQQLKSVADWQVQLQHILKSRLKEELGRRRNRAGVSIQDRLQFKTTSESLKG